MNRVLENNVSKFLVSSLAAIFIGSFIYDISSNHAASSFNENLPLVTNNLGVNQAVIPNQPIVNTPSNKANFDQAVSFTLKHEGGLANDKSDSGGMTNYGISYVYLKGLLKDQPELLSEFALSNVSQISPAIIKNMTKQQAIQIYYTQWWLKNNFGALNNQAIATKAFDYSVNMGATVGIKLLQTACQQQSGTQQVAINGQMDSATINYINSLNPQQANQLLSTYNNVASQRYYDIAADHPKDKKFLSGWLKRANDNSFVTAA